MGRFVFSFQGEVDLSEGEFFPNGVPAEIGLDEISEEMKTLTLHEILNDWYLEDSLGVTMTDRDTGAVWEYNGKGFNLVKARRLLKGEQRLF